MVTPKPDAAKGAAQAAAPAPVIDQVVAQAAARQSVPAGLIHSVIQVESNYDRYAVSRKGAMGLMQLVPATARRFGVTDVFDAADNIEGGAKYLKYLLELYGGDNSLALAAYNAGEANVAKYGGIPPFAETRSYVRQVSKRMAAPRPVAPAAPAAASNQERAQGDPRGPGGPPYGTNHIREIIEADGAVRYVTQ